MTVAFILFAFIAFATGQPLFMDQYNTLIQVYNEIGTLFVTPLRPRTLTTAMHIAGCGPLCPRFMSGQNCSGPVKCVGGNVVDL
jgi:hypothetical protein